MRAADFREDQRQAVVWTADFAPSARRLIELATGPWARLFSGSPMVLPTEVRNILPPEAPQFVVSSADSQWRLQVGGRRTDIFWRELTSATPTSQEDFIREVNETHRAFFDALDAGRVTRLAYLVHRWTTSPAPGRELVEYFIQPALRTSTGPLNRPQEFQLHAHKRYEPAQLPVVNSWVKWIAGAATATGQPTIGVEQDLNTLAEDEAQSAYSPTRVREFFERAPLEADAILRRYLPDHTEEGVQ